MTELKKKNKRTMQEVDEKPLSKKLKPDVPSDKLGTYKKSGKSSSTKFDKKGKSYKPGKIQHQQHQTPGEKVNWIELKQKKKDLKIQRRKNKDKDLYDIDVQAKKIYEELKMKNTKANKEQLCQQLHSIMKNAEYSKLSLSPDRARIIQTLLKKAPLPIKTEIAEKLIPVITNVALSKYGKFCVSRMMVYCGKEIRDKAVNGLLKHIVKLTTHNFSNNLIDTIYCNHASPDQKNLMKQEFYSDLYKNDKNRAVKTLKDTWTGSELLKNGILNSTKMNLLKVASKNLTDNSLVHAVLLEYIEACEETDRDEIITAFIPHLATIASTKQGSRAACLCYLHSIAKERRAMLKSVKEHVAKLCVHEHGHLLILEILNSTDDTLNIKKTLFAVMTSEIEKIVNSEFGKRVILFIVSPTKEFFHPGVLKQLEDDLKIGTQKKDIEIRRKELIDFIVNDLAEAIKQNPKYWLKGGHTARVTLAVLQCLRTTTVNSEQIFDVLCSLISDPGWMVPENELDVPDTPPTEAKDTGTIKKKKNPTEIITKGKEVALVKGIEHGGLHMAIKKIAKLEMFPKTLFRYLSDDTIEHWIGINRACFVIVECIENADEETKIELKRIISQHKLKIQEQNHMGAKVLLKNL